MLAELTTVMRELRRSGFTLEVRHPDIKVARRLPTAFVRLSSSGRPASVVMLPADTRCWTLRDGQHNSFPFVQFKQGLVRQHGDSEQTPPRDVSPRRDWLLERVTPVELAQSFPADWPGGLVERLRARREQLQGLRNAPGSAMVDSIDRFLVAVGTPGGSTALLLGIAELLIRELEQSADPAILDATERVLIGPEAAFMFDADGVESVLDPSTVRYVSDALSAVPLRTSDYGTDRDARCGLTGDAGPIVTGPFPQPNLPQIGQTFVFARNRDIPANSRYNRSAAASMPVGINVANEIAAAITMITEPERRFVTWRPVPGEVPGDTDLLIAFAQADLDAPVAASFCGEDDADDDFDDEPNSQAIFEVRAQRVIDAVRAHVGADFETSRLRLLIIRQVDPANRKIVYSGTPSIKELKTAAQEWSVGASTIPQWLTLQVRHKKTRREVSAAPRVFAPLRLVAMSRSVFVDRGLRVTGAPGLPAAEVLRLFLDTGSARDTVLVRRILHLLLTRRKQLLVHVAGQCLRPERALKLTDVTLGLNSETLRTVSALSILLTKLDRADKYMDDSPFKLGQLLAAADRVHAGYCADVRGGQLPSSLLGNQVLTMAQAAPIKALAVLSSRWKPYKAWADRIDITAQRAKFDGWTRENDPEHNWRGWAVLHALRHNREMRTLAPELEKRGFTNRPDDAFRAELLLGYLSGLPPQTKGDAIALHNENESPKGDE